MRNIYLSEYPNAFLVDAIPRIVNRMNKLLISEANEMGIYKL